MDGDPPDNLGKHQSTFSAATGDDVDTSTYDDQGRPTADTTVPCHKCGILIHVGTGGDFNYDEHVDKGPCVRQQKKNRKQLEKDKQIAGGKKAFQFFKKIVRAVSPTVTSAPPVLPVLAGRNDSPPPILARRNDSPSELDRSPSPVPSQSSSFAAGPTSSLAPSLRSSSVSLGNTGNSDFESSAPSPRSTSPSIGDYNGNFFASAASPRSSSPSLSHSSRPHVDQDDELSPSAAPADTPEVEVFLCPGLELIFPPGQNAHLSYPFAAHARAPLWNYATEGDRFFLRATNCVKILDDGVTVTCHKCTRLESNEVLRGIRDRIRNGVKEHSNYDWFPIGGLIEKLHRKADQNSELRLTRLNDARKLVAKIAELDVHKQLMMAIASGEVNRVVPLLQAGFRNGESARALLERFYRACVDVYREGPTYNPKGFTQDEYMVGICVLRLGGARLADILHRALGLPGLTTLRKHAIIRPLRASPALPTISEIEDNINAYTDGEEIPTGPPRIIHRVIILDEMAVERRARWDDKTNMILGACREHSAKVPLEFATVDDATQFFDAIANDEVHLATEATVVALGALSHDPREYNPQPICISGTCKQETGVQQAAFLKTVYTAARNRRAHGNIIYRDVSVASDGESKRGAALVLEYMKFNLDPASPIYPLLHPLEFMNLRVGPDEVTPDKDSRHTMKTVRTLLMRQAGIKLLGFHIKPAIVKQHLRAVGNSKERVDSLMNPNDKQDVSLGYQLLKELWSLPDALPTDTPGFTSARKALQVFGRLGYNLVMPYICITLSLREQLIHLSTAAHLLLILFTTHRAGTDFMANQTFVNIMLMIKNAFFCVAKAKIDMPDAEFFLILLGTDRLEKLFGLIRTAIGTDSNVDVYQLAGRASNLTEVSKILTLRPAWDRGPRRLKLPAIINANGDISKTADHVSPPSWIGDVRLSTAILHGCWLGGRKRAEGIVPGGKETLERCAQVPGFDMICPLGRVLVGVLDPDAAFEPDPELFRPSPDEVNPVDPEPERATATDIDDMLAMDDSTRDTTLKHSPHIIVDGKKVSKATILSNLMQGRSTRLSTDRTRRVAGVGAFNNSAAHGLITFDGPLGAPSLRLGNPIVSIVKCEKLMFLAIGLVNGITFGTQDTESIALDLLPDGGTKISYQILRLVTATMEDDPTAVHDWRWSGSFEATCSDVPGILIHPLNPTLSNRTPGKPTYLFSSDVLVTLGATVSSQADSADLQLAPVVKRTEKFPYRHNGKLACFDIDAGADRGEIHGHFNSEPHQCAKCNPEVPLTSAQHTLVHNGSHILFDPSIHRADQPCGLCLRPSPICRFELTKTEGTSTVRQIDWRRSVCRNPLRFKMTSAKKSTRSSPCTNHLILCPLQCGRVIWTYNLDAHCRASPHYLNSLDSVPQVYQMAPNELKLMQEVYSNRSKVPKPRNLKRNKQPPLTISQAHSASNALKSRSNPTSALKALSNAAPPANYDSTDSSESEYLGGEDGSDNASVVTHLSYLDEPVSGPRSPRAGPAPLQALVDDDIDREIQHFSAPGIEYAPEDESDDVFRIREAEPLQALVDDDVDREIQHFSAPGIDYAGKDESGNISRGSVNGSVDIPASKLDQDLTTSAPVENPTHTSLLLAAPLATVPATSAGSNQPTKRTRKTLEVADKTCDCGLVVSSSEKSNPQCAIECGKAGCESGWYHLECIGLEETVKGWGTLVKSPPASYICTYHLNGTDEPKLGDMRVILVQLSHECHYPERGTNPWDNLQSEWITHAADLLWESPSQPSEGARHILHSVCDTIRQESGGMNVGDIQITASIVKAHLEEAGVDNRLIEYLLSRFDRQDTRKAITLLVALANLPDPASDSTSEFRGTREALQIVGRLGSPEAAVAMSGLGPADLANSGENFTSSQPLPVNVPHARLVGIASEVLPAQQLGTDVLEHMFGIVRVAVGQRHSFGGL
ncbi:hypothetical protein C8R46DRAFT_1197422 [Mycena filopes]|nr:hypothetical protein C8R46DRAFT_1197422 [Mycena filopes]